MEETSAPGATCAAEEEGEVGAAQVNLIEPTAEKEGTQLGREAGKGVAAALGVTVTEATEKRSRCGSGGPNF